MSSNSFFLGGVDLKDIALARIDERESIATYAQLIDEVRARCGADVASLFAEPIRGTSRTTGVPNVAWYCSVEGTPFPFRQLEGPGRQAVTDLLKQRLHAFSSLFSDSRHGATFASWLHLLSPESVLAVAGQPVIKNWGMLPAAIATSAESRDTHFHNGLGLYLPALPPPPFVEIEAQSFLARMAQFADRETARATPPGGVPVPPPPPVVALPVRVAIARPWLAPAIACAVAALVLAILLFGHVLRYPIWADRPDQAAIEAQRQTNQALRDRLQSLRAAANGVCVAPPGTPGRSGDATPTLPPSLQQTKVTTTDPATSRPETSTLGALLEKATVLVVLDHSLGSGFFISDRHIVTNHHVVGTTREVRVGSRALGGLVPAKVIAVGAGAERGTQDIAVLEIEPRPGTSFLPVGVAPERLQQVTAAGFPGAVLETIKADQVSSVPEANFTQGIVTSHQVQQPAGIETIIHTAQIGHGNSGGPLVDAGGCAVGINSWLSPDAMDHIIFSTYFQALDAAELRKFLQAHDIRFSASDTTCKPVAPPTPPAPAPQPAPTP